MKTKKLLRKIKAILSADRRAQLAKADSLEKILEKLEKKAVTLREKLDGDEDEERRRELVQKLEVVEAQREKGEKLKAELGALGDVSRPDD
jgi:hypothetical protein